MTDTSSSIAERDREAAAARNTKERVLVFIVVFLGLLIVAGIAAVVLRIIYLSNTAAPQPGLSRLDAPGALGAGEPVSLALPPNAAIKSLSLSDDRLAVHYDVAGRSAIAVVDLKSGAVLRRLDVVPEEPAR